MKYLRLLIIVSILCFNGVIRAQDTSTDHNFVQEDIMLLKNIKDTAEIASLTKASKSVNISYYDGLGRLDQNISWQASPSGKDIVSFKKYDDFGRESKVYLPFEANSKTIYDKFGRDYMVDNNGTYIMHALTDQMNFYSSKYGDDGTFPFSETIMEASPLGRVLEQGFPGKNWQTSNSIIVGAGHTRKTEYGTNSQYDVLLFKRYGSRVINTGGESNGFFNFYKANQLYKTTIKDENWESGKLHTNEEYKDKQGHVVLQRSYVDTSHIAGVIQIAAVETYYVYDDYGLLRNVIPPEAINKNYRVIQESRPNRYILYYDEFATQKMTGNYEIIMRNGSSFRLLPGFSYKASASESLSITATSLSDKLMYSYRYDEFQRMIEKEIPGASPVYMVYDDRDRLVATQDGEMRKNGEWLFTKYDILNRPIVTGKITNNLTTQSAMQAVVDNYYSDTSKKYYESRDNNLSGSYSYTTSNSFPEVGVDRWLSVTYYDTYGYKDSKAFSTENNISDETTYNHAVKGQVTGTRTKVLDGNEFSSSQAQWLVSTVYYDQKYRVIQSLTDLFPGNDGANYTLVSNNYDFVGKVESTKTINVFQGITKIIDERFDYDHAGRLLKHYHKINGKNEVLLADNTYNELGELITKKVGNNVQQMDYQYNIRGWLTQINNPAVAASGNKKFALKLDYNAPSSVLNAQRQYNGNISSMIWRTEAQSNVTGNMSAYGFNYDGLNRLTQANYGQGSSSIARNSAYDVTIGNYDLNGNVGSLTRKKASTTIDNLSYSYIGNQLLSVNDAANDQVGFKEKSGSGTEYNYDLNGNMTADKNKGLVNVKYNFLNLPELLTGDDNKTIRYIYTADGQKVATTADGKTTYYAGLAIYEESTLKQVLHSEGTIAMNGSSAIYQYHLKDHLGNTRVVVDENNTTNQVSFYYPFGMTAEQFNTSVENKYLYNGKELQDDAIGGGILDWYDYGARMYDPAIARFTTIDPKTEEFSHQSPFVYADNNPIRFIDFMGMNADVWQLDENDNLVRTKETEDDFNVFIDSDGNEIFRTNEMISPRDGEKINARIDKINKVLSEISSKDGVYSKMEERAEETGFDNTVIKGGISELKVIADKQVDKQAVIESVNLALSQIITINKGSILNTYDTGSAIYKGITGGRNLITDTKSFVQDMGNKIEKGVNKSIADTQLSMPPVVPFSPF